MESTNDGNGEKKPAVGKPKDDSQFATAATSAEDDVLASLGTTRAETSNYESDVLKQATYQLAPKLTPLTEDGFPDLASTSLLPFAKQGQAKANRQVLTRVLAQLQTQMKDAASSNNADNNNMRLLAMKQQMIWSLLGLQSKKPSVQKLAQEQPVCQAAYREWEQTVSSGAQKRKGRISMMQRKQIPGAVSLQKLQSTTGNNRKKKQQWKDWSSDEEEEDENDVATNSVHRGLLAEMNISRRQRQKEQQTSGGRKPSMKPSATKKPTLKSKQKPTRSRTSSRTSSRTITTTSNDPKSEPAIPQRSKRKRTQVASYAEDDHENEIGHEDDIEDERQFEHGDSRNNGSENDNNATEHENNVAIKVENTLHHTTTKTANVICPLCQTEWTVEDATQVDAELSQHMSQCNGRPSRTRRRQPLQYYAETDENDTEEIPSRAKRKRIEPTTYKEDDDGELEKPFTENHAAVGNDNEDDDNFVFDDDIEEDEELQADNDEEDLLTKPTSVDDYRLDDYEDRVDYWQLHGVSEMRDMSQLRAEGEVDPGAVTLQGGLHIPAWMNNRLFGYQRTGLEWMWTLHQQQAGGVMGDQMGLGKTVQVSSFLGAMAASRKLKGVLIISPATMLQHWLKELAVWAPGLRRVLIHASGDTNGSVSLDTPTRNLTNHASAIFRNLRNWLKRARRDCMHEEIHDPDKPDEEDPDSFCGTGYAVVTTYEHVRRNQDIYVDHPWSYVVLDEAQKIRNPNADITLACKRLRTPHRIAMTGTPIQNDLKELWSLFDFVFPGRLGTLPAFDQEFADPIRRGGYSNASPVQVQLAYRCSLVLRDLIDPYLLRRQKTEIEEVKKMPSKTEHVLFCRLSKRQRRMYEAYLQSDVVKRIFRGSTMLFAAVTMLRKICNHPDLVLADPSKDALEAFLMNGCVPEHPMVSDEEDEEDEEMEDYDYQAADEDLAKRSGKFEVLSKILPLWKKQGHRVLIFSQWTKMLNIIEKFVRLQGWKFSRLDGKTNVASRQRLVDTFNNDDSYFGMLCTTRTGGVGLNLTGANRIILYDIDWNPQTDAQARERAWRFGQERAVTVYRLCTAGTIEEKMYQRQIFKTALTNKVLHDPRQRRLFSQKDLHDLLTLQPDNGNARSGGEVIETTDRIAKASAHGGGGGGGIDSRDVSKDDGETLESVMKSKGLAGVFDHNFVDPSASANKSASAREMEEQAKRIAKEAADALKASVQSKSNDVGEDQFTPTWTGSSESRFGGGGGGGSFESRGSGSSSFGGAGTAGVRRKNGGDKSSKSLLASLRQQNAAIKSGGASRRPSTEGSDSKTKTKYTKLMMRIRDYVRQHRPTTDQLLDEFASVPTDDAAIFKRLLNSVAKSEQGRWNVRSEYR